MRIAVRCRGTTKTGVTTLAVYADDLYIGVVKNNGDHPLQWRVVVPRYIQKLLPDRLMLAHGYVPVNLIDLCFASDYQAARAILVFYKHCTELVPKRLHSIRKKNCLVTQIK